MDIYILHRGQESGPHSEKTVSQLLDQGSIAPSDYAWRQGMADWRPLSEVLGGQARFDSGVREKPPQSGIRAREEVQKHPEPGKADTREAPGAPMTKASEPATAKQKALLTFLRIALPAGLSKDKASGLINDAMEDPQHASRMALWNDERLRLHPELFATEIQARKENRANHFFELCQTTGAEYFSGISKAHCQVLVSFLDVKFPHWGTPEADAAENYFFPAVAEKFPQLVQKQWRGRLRYTDGGRVSAEIVQKSATSKIHRSRTSALAAISRGVVIGLILLGALYAGHRVLQREATAAIPIEGASTPAAASVVPPASATPAPAMATTAPLAEPPAARPPRKRALKPVDVAGTAPTPVATPTGASSMEGSGMASMGPNGGSEPPAPAAPPPPTLPVAGTLPAEPQPPMASTELASPVLGPDPMATNPGAAASLPPSAIAAPLPTAATARIQLLLTRPVEIQLPYGKITIPPGTPVKLVSRQGGVLRVSYQNSIITVPAGFTDLE